MSENEAYAGFSPAEIQEMIRQAGVNSPVMSVRVVGGRVELHLLGGTVVPVVPATNETTTSATTTATTASDAPYGRHTEESAFLETLTVPQLREIAARLGLSGYSNARRKRLATALAETYTVERLKEALDAE